MTTVELFGVKIYGDPILLPSLLEMAMGLGIGVKLFKREKGQFFCLMVDPENTKRNTRDSIYFSDGKPEPQLMHPRSLVNFNGATYEAELRHVSDPANRKLIVCTDSRNLLGLN